MPTLPKIAETRPGEPEPRQPSGLESLLETRRLPRVLLVLAVALACAEATPAEAAGAARSEGEEVLRYRWDLGGFLGSIASLFIPGQGEGTLTTGPDADGHLRSELHITSPKSRKGEFWRYGAEIEPGGARTLRVWSAYLFRGRAKEKSAELDGDGVIDVASGIYLLRQTPPAASRRMRIWSDGKIYPVAVEPVGREARRIGSREIAVRHYAVRGVQEEGARFWKGKLDLFLAEDAAATPVEIRLARSGSRVRLLLCAN